jgi:hypothetical protein
VLCDMICIIDEQRLNIFQLNLYATPVPERLTGHPDFWINLYILCQLHSYNDKELRKVSDTEGEDGTCWIFTTGTADQTEYVR